MWWIQKRISTHISLQRTKTYDTLVKQYRTKPRSHEEKEKEDLEGTSTGMAEAEAEFHKSMTDLISALLTERGKVPRGHGVALASNVLQLVPSLPLNPVLTACMDLPPKKECRIVSREMPRSPSSGPSTPGPLPSSPLTGTMGGLSPAKRSTIRFGQAVNAVIWPITHISPAVDFSFFKKPLPVEVPMSPMRWKSLGASSTPLSKPSIQTLWKDLNRTDLVDLMGCEDDDMFTPCKEGSSKLKEAHGSSKCMESQPRRPAWIPLGPTRDPNQNHVPCGMSGMNVRFQPKSLSTRTCATCAPVTDLKKELFQK